MLLKATKVAQNQSSLAAGTCNLVFISKP